MWRQQPLAALSMREIGARSTEAARVAVAPYFLYRLDAGTKLPAAQRAAFGEDGELIRREAQTARAQGKRLAVYEENFHTTLGTADAASRDAVVAGAASGPALARRLLQGTLAGIREQAVYSFAGFDSYLQEGKGLVRLWGVTRDLAYADRLRPTGLALAMLNRVAGGAAQAVRCSGTRCDDLTAVSFDGGRRFAVVSGRAEAVSVLVPCPQDVLQMDLLDGSNPALNNENATRIVTKALVIACRDGQAVFSLPAYSLATLGVK